MENVESQKNELLALRYIYDEKDFVADDSPSATGRFFVNIRLPDPFSVDYKSVNDEIAFEIEFLPPITLFFQLPETYPSETCPAFLLSCEWLTLSQITILCKKLESLWESTRDVILFTWVQFLEDEALSFLSIHDRIDITELMQFERNRVKHLSASSLEYDRSAEPNETANCDVKEVINIKPSISGGDSSIDIRAFNDLANGKHLPQIIKNYNQKRAYDVFCSSNHDCDVCFLSKRGSEFIIFEPCKHVFCKDCLKSYFEVQIVEGNIHSLHCPNGTCKTYADSSTVKQVVDKVLFEKYDNLLLSRSLDSMSDIAYCPRRDCQCPVVIDIVGRIGVCSVCQYAFCPLCKMCYHGVAACSFKIEDRQKVYDLYVNGDEEEKLGLEKRYGKRAVMTLVEDAMSESWKNDNSKNCPQCDASIEKSEGCHKMTCFRCGSFFCWLCKRQLNDGNPYNHYSDRKSKCYNRLFPEDYEDEF